MALISAQGLHLAFGHVPLLEGAGFSLERGERVGLIGRNGAGKSSLLKIIAGIERPDDGIVQRTQNLRIRYVPQEPLFDAQSSVFDAVAEGIAEARALRDAYERHEPDTDLDALQSRIDALDAWNWERRVEQTLAHLSRRGGRRRGTRKRVALARALVAVPDVLLLDEPTNHLDLDAIAWLEELLRGFAGATIVVTHDRAFLDAVATRIVELDRAVLRSYPGAFAAYERVKADQLAAEALGQARADKLLAAEEVWVRQGVEARRTRAVGRVTRLERLRAQRRARREQLGQVKLELDTGAPSGRIVAELRDVTMQFGGSDRSVIDGFSATILRGDKVGIIGPNGAGKTTLLKLILGELNATAGTVRRGTRQTVAYFDQLRAGLDLDATLANAISPGSDWVEIGGARRHVMGYLADFLFSPERANAPLSTLSGGERNRVLLARLFALPANVLVLDEPTNDLDLDTLELLEERLSDYAGTVFVVSHDRRFLDNVVTSTIAWAGDEKSGLWREHEGGYSDWKLQRERARAMREAPAPAPAPAKAATPKASPAAPVVRKKLGFKEQRELDALPGRIEALEAEQRELAALLADGSIYATDRERAVAAQLRHAAIDGELMALMQRWEGLAGS